MLVLDKIGSSVDLPLIVVLTPYIIGLAMSNNNMSYLSQINNFKKRSVHPKIVYTILQGQMDALIDEIL